MKVSFIVASILVLSSVAGSQQPFSASYNEGRGELSSPRTSKEIQGSDSKSNEQVLELIVKIAEHPNTWKQIHRVLETLEANNAAYSKRIQAIKKSRRPALVVKKAARNGDERNDVPENTPSLDVAFQRWKDLLFSHQEPLHPQLKMIESDENSNNKSPNNRFPFLDETSALLLPEAEPTKTYKSDPLESKVVMSFEERLKDIEEELKKLNQHNSWTKSKLFKYLQVKNAPSPSKLTNETTSQKFNHSVNNSSHPKMKHNFLYHKVRNSSRDDKPGPQFWKRIAAARTSGNSTSKRKTFVAVSILSSDKTKKPLGSSTKPLKTETPQRNEDSVPCKKKNHQVRKEKQREALINNNDGDKFKYPDISKM